MDEVRVIQRDHIPTLAVSEEATLEIVADRATVDIEVRVNIREQKSALPRNTVVDNVRAVLSRNQLLRSNGETLQQFMGHKDRAKTEWNITLVAEPIGDAAVQEQLQDAISRLAGIEDCLVTGPNWELSAEAQTRADIAAHARAVRNARAKAEAVAAELGYTVTGLAQVTAGHSTVGPVPVVVAESFAAFETKTRAPVRAMDVSMQPATIAITGHIQAVFILHPAGSPNTQ